MHPQIYLAQIPAVPAERRALRARALDLRARLLAVRSPESITLLRFAAGAAAAVENRIAVAAPAGGDCWVLRAYRGPVVAAPGGPSVYRDGGEPIREPRGHTPPQYIGAQRDAVRERIERAAGLLPGLEAGAQPFDPVVRALICMPPTPIRESS